MFTSKSHEEVSSHFDGMRFIVESGSDAQVYELEYLVAVMLVAVARSDGHIDNSETDQMLQLVSDYFQMRNSSSLDLLTRAVKKLADAPDLTDVLRGWSNVLTPLDKEDIAVMMLKVVAADGRRDAEEMATLNRAARIIDISPEILHLAFQRFFSEQDET